MPDQAPFYTDVTDGPEVSACRWITASDGVRLRMAAWDKGDRGTVLLFPGRTEFVEKYSRTAGELKERGYAMAAIDWRGQGLADRLIPDPLLGYVGRFLDYQKDVAVFLHTVEELGLPKPYHLVAHSMGGAIGLRALMHGLPVNAAFFSAPMWGIGMASYLRPIAWVVSYAARLTGQGRRYTPGTGPENYLATVAFEENTLTRDRDMFDWLKNQVVAHPELLIGGPSLHWMNEALRETRALVRAKAPDIPALTFLGADEEIVHTDPIHRRMATWPGSRLEMVKGGLHEMLLDSPEMRARLLDAAAEHFETHRYRVRP